MANQTVVNQLVLILENGKSPESMIRTYGYKGAPKIPDFHVEPVRDTSVVVDEAVRAIAGAYRSMVEAGELVPRTLTVPFGRRVTEHDFNQVRASLRHIGIYKVEEGFSVSWDPKANKYDWMHRSYNTMDGYMQKARDGRLDLIGALDEALKVAVTRPVRLPTIRKYKVVQKDQGIYEYVRNHAGLSEEATARHVNKLLKDLRNEQNKAYHGRNRGKEVRIRVDRWEGSLLPILQRMISRCWLGATLVFLRSDEFKLIVTERSDQGGDGCVEVEEKELLRAGECRARSSPDDLVSYPEVFEMRNIHAHKGPLAKSGLTKSSAEARINDVLRTLSYKINRYGHLGRSVSTFGTDHDVPFGKIMRGLVKDCWPDWVLERQGRMWIATPE